LYQAVQFESAMADVRKVVDFDTPEQFRQMGQDILELSARLPISAKGIAEIAAAAGQFGIARNGILDFTESAAKMAVAFDMTPEQAGEAMAKIRSLTGLSQEGMISLGDAINHLSNNTAASAPELLNFTKRIAGIAKTAGLSEEKTAAMGTAFIAMGSAPEVAARAAEALISKLAIANHLGEKSPATAALGELGYNLAELEEQMKFDPQGTILNFLDRVGKQKNVLASLNLIMGSGFDDDIANLLNGLETYKKALALVEKKENYDGSMEKEYAARAATTTNELQLLNNQVSRLAVNLGTALLPGLNAVVKPMGEMIGVVGRLAAKHPGLTKVVGGLAAGFLGLKVAVLGTRIGWSHIRDGGSIAMDIFQRLRPSVIQNSLEMARLAGNGSTLSGMFKNLRGGVGSFAKSFTADLSALKAGMGAVFTPLTIGAALLAGSIFLVWRNWEEFSKVWTDGCAAMGKAWNEGRIGDAIMTGLATPLGSVMVLLKDLGTLWNDFVNSFKIFNSREATSNAFKAVRDRQAAGEYQSGDDALGSAAAGAQYAIGGFINRPVTAQIGEAGPEYVIPVGSAYRERGRSLLGRAASALGLSVTDGQSPIRLGSSLSSANSESGESPFAGWADKLRNLAPQPPQMAMAGAGGGMSNVINIYPSPGMDENALADRVIQKLEELEARRRRGAYSDASFFR
jgi:TP901 family phage tail tape measure protein